MIVGHSGIILVRILKLRTNSHDLKTTLDVIRTLRNRGFLPEGFREVACKIQRAAGNVVKLLQKIERILPSVFVRRNWKWLTSAGRDGTSDGGADYVSHAGGLGLE